TKGLSKEQVQALEQVAEGELNLKLLLQDELFTEEELDEIGIMPANRLPAASDRGAINIDLSELDINDLNLEGLTDIQIEAVKQAIAGEKTLQSMMSERLFTQDELRAIGLIGTDGLGGQGQGSKGGGGN
ncbi:MAG: hypothetical protein KAH14_10410, partial [Clostridiales bacterium]|nr:hypothetical protein [Clostridiales bacterium]